MNFGLMAMRTKGSSRMNVDHQFDKNEFTQRIVLSAEESQKMLERHSAGLSASQQATLVGYLDQLAALMGALGAPLYDELFTRAMRILADTTDLLRPELLKGYAAAEQWRRSDADKGH